MKYFITIHKIQCKLESFIVFIVVSEMLPISATNLLAFFSRTFNYEKQIESEISWRTNDS